MTSTYILQMKATKIKASVHTCSGCGYWSLIKTHVSNHIKAKCSEAQVITTDKIVSHFEEHDTETFKATLYQCSKCFYTTFHKPHMSNHVVKQCKGAEMLCAKRILCVSEVPKKTDQQNTSGPVLKGENLSLANAVGNSTAINNSYNTTTNNIIVIPPSSSEEYIALVKTLVEQIASGKLKLPNDMSDLPVLLHTLSCAANPALDNKEIVKNDVVSKTDGTVVAPRVKHGKHQVKLLVDALYEAMTATDVEDWRDFEKYETETYAELEEFRERVLPILYDENHSMYKIIESEFPNNPEQIRDMKDDIPTIYDSMKAEFFRAIDLLITDPKTFSLAVDKNIRVKVRTAIKKYLSTLREKQQTRPNNSYYNPDK